MGISTGRVIITILFCIISMSVDAQSARALFKSKTSIHSYLNLNKENGLPTNFVYYLIVDHYGYLWISTPKGIARYNGYEVKQFGLNNGLPYEDIWSLKEDNMGRIWLSTIDNEMGYIKDEQYQTVVQDTRRIYPKGVEPINEDAVILNVGTSDIYTPRMEIIHASNKVIKRHILPPDIRSAFLDHNLRLVILSPGKIYSWVLGKSNKWTYLKDYDPIEYHNKMAKAGTIGFKDYLISVDKKENKLWLLSLTKSGSSICNISPINDTEDKIINAYGLDGELFVIGSKRTYVMDSTFRVIRTYSLPEITNNEKQEEHQHYMVYTNQLWGTLVSTKDKGVYINRDVDNRFLKSNDLDVNGFHYLGSLDDNTGYWWSNTTRTLIQVGENGIIRKHYYPHLFDVQKINRHSPGIVSLTAPSGIYWLSVKDGSLTPCALNQFTDNNNIRDAVMLDSSTAYAILSARSTLVRLSTATTPHWQYINDLQGYNRIKYDKIRNGIWLYSDRHLGFYSIGQNKILKWDPAALKAIGLKKIEQLLVDDVYGNIFIKESENIYLFDDSKKKLTPVCPQYVYSDCNLNMDNEKLTIYGSFGLLQLTITGKGRLKESFVLLNNKNLNYDIINDVQVLNNHVLLKTDKGLYKIHTDSAKLDKHVVTKEYSNQYRVVLSTKNITKLVQYVDTAILDPRYPVIQFDAVNPSGSGKLMFEYSEKDNNVWTFLTDNKLDLTGQSNKTLTVHVRAKDATSRSDPYEIVIRIKPYWWQTTKYIIGISLLFLTGVIIMIWIIRRILVKRFEQKQLLTELALRGVHAQINPHFIFNTLLSAQYFIRSNKPQEAYDHINRFSKILRNVLSASKYKYITINDEINNLNDYIALQQTRFVDKFDYKLYISPTVNIQLKIPALLLQPLVENAIIHGLNNNNEHGNLSISIIWDNDLQIYIEDDGIGRERAKKIQNQSVLKTESHGSDLLKKLLYMFNRYEQTKISVSYIDKTPPESGTTVHITIYNALL